MNERIADAILLLRNRAIWGHFPKDMRVYFVAQRGRCPYCPGILPVEAVAQGIKHKDKAAAKARCSWDHVFPKARWGSTPTGYVVAHQGCNTRKGMSTPHPCEVLYRDVTNEIIRDIHLARSSAGGYASSGV